MKIIKIKNLILLFNLFLISLIMLFLGKYIVEILSICFLNSKIDIKLILAAIMLIAMFVYLGILPLFFMVEYYLRDKNLIININQEEKTILYKSADRDILFKFDDIVSYSVYHYVRVPAGYSKIVLLSGDIIYISFLVPLDAYILRNKNNFKNIQIHNKSKFLLRMPNNCNVTD